MFFLWFRLSPKPTLLAALRAASGEPARPRGPLRLGNTSRCLVYIYLLYYCFYIEWNFRAGNARAAEHVVVVHTA